jgi:hypothetical protein
VTTHAELVVFKMRIFAQKRPWHCEVTDTMVC